jgi:hypothetical protein
MKSAVMSAIVLAAALATAGCGDSSSDTDDSGDTGSGSGSGPGSGSGGSGTGGGSSSSSGSGGTGASDLEWTTLITGEWLLEPGQEKTSDIHTLMLNEDIYIGAIRPISPPGTHHTVLALNGLDIGQIVYASGVGTNPLVFPPGVGLKLSAGETLVLQLHIFNVSPQTMTGLSGIEVVRIDPADVVNEADLALPGPLNFSIPPNQEHTASGTCTVDAPQTVFAIFPHMHQLGKHFKSTLTVGGQPMVIHDDAYQFDHQPFLSFEPIALQPGDTIDTECTWNNTTSSEVGWGESSTTEMCFSILFRYPPQPGGFCTN